MPVFFQKEKVFPNPACIIQPINPLLLPLKSRPVAYSVTVHNNVFYIFDNVTPLTQISCTLPIKHNVELKPSPPL